MTDVTQILSQIGDGDGKAAERLLPLVYDELRKLAAQKMAQENPGQTLQATVLVHEAYLRLVGSGGSEQSWDNGGHFFAAAAEAMRRILVENARRKERPKHGGDRRRVALTEVASLAEEQRDEILAVNEALTRLGEESPETADLVKLRYFAGMSLREAADALGIPRRSTASKHWAYAKSYLYCQMEDAGEF